MTQVNPGTSPECYSIFTGIFLYQDRQLLSPAFVPWTNRLQEPNQLFAHLKKTYHDNYYSTIFDDGSVSRAETFNSLIAHETKREVIEAPFQFSFTGAPDLIFKINWFDRHLFSEGIGLFGFKVSFAESQQASYEGIATLIRQIRNPECRIIHQGQEIKLLELVKAWLSPGLSLPPDWDKYQAMPKHFTIVNDPTTASISIEHKRVLFELAHAMPIGTVTAKNANSPTEDYFNQVFKGAAIEVYGNWNALCLLDSFTRISTQFTDTFHSWEIEYYNVYVFCLYFKYKLFHFNDQWKTASLNKKKASILNDKFVAFLSDYSSTTIAYKFLPNLLFEKMMAALEIEEQQEMMEKKMARITEIAESKTNVMNESVAQKGSVILPEFEYDIYISYRPNDNKFGWVTEFVDQLKDELASTIKYPINICFNKNTESEVPVPAEVLKNLNSLLFIPIVSHTYCDISSFSWQNEIVEFNRLSQHSQYGRDIRLETGNVTSRILPVCIHEIDEEDKVLFVAELGMTLRPVDFIYRESGVNRPLKPEDDSKENLNKTSYRNQINKIANAVKDVVKGMKKSTANG